jgi:hypothetical protein
MTYSDSITTVDDFDLWQGQDANITCRPSLSEGVRVNARYDAATDDPLLTDADFATHFARLLRIEKDRTLWPEDGAPPDHPAIETALMALRQLMQDTVQPTQVVASAEGGVAICFVQGERYADIECLNDGTVLGVTSNRRDRPLVWEINPRMGGFALASSRIRRFLDGAPSKNVPSRAR